MNGRTADAITIEMENHAGQIFDRRDIGRKTKKPASRAAATPWIFAALIALVLVAGWQQSGYRYITAEGGVGYALGVIGGSLMLALLLYPLRKRLRIMGRTGSVRAWFRMHMLFGVLGPTLIVLHSNFSLGSTNSSVALISMLIVAASGVVGRFLFSRSHFGMLGHRQALKAMQAERHVHLRALTPLIDSSETLSSVIAHLPQHLVGDDRGLASSLSSLVRLNGEAGKVRRTARAEIKRLVARTASLQGWTRPQHRAYRRNVLRELDAYVSLVIRVAQFDVYERLFSLWHVLHLPLFILLVITGVFHVLAVHMY